MSGIARKLMGVTKGAAPSGGWDLSTAVYSQSFSVTSQETEPRGMAFNTDGTKMFIVGSAGDDVNEYTLSTGFNISTASYSQNFSLSAQSNSFPSEITFNTDGTKMFVVGRTSRTVYEYTLGTGFDISTASFSQSFYVAQEAFPQGIAFKPDGTKMFLVGSVGDRVYEYTLGTGFDISTVSYLRNLSVSAQDTSPQGIAFKPDGTKMFIVGTGADSVYEYTLGTSFNISTASYSQNFSVSAQDTVPQGIAFNTNGTKMFIVGSVGDSVYEYNL